MARNLIKINVPVASISISFAEALFLPQHAVAVTDNEADLSCPLSVQCAFSEGGGNVHVPTRWVSLA